MYNLIVYILEVTARCVQNRTYVEKQKLESVENVPAFLRRSNIGQFVTRDGIISPWRHSGGGSKSRLVRSGSRDESTLRA